MTVRLLADLRSRLSNTLHGNEAQDLRDLLESVYGLRFIDAVTLSGVTNFDITVPAGYAGLHIFGQMLPSTQDDLLMRMGAAGTPDAGNNYDAARGNAGDSQSGLGQDGTTNINLGSIHGGDEGSPLDIQILPGYDDASQKTQFFWRTFFTSATTQFVYNGAGKYLVDASVDIFRMFASGGVATLSGTMNVFGWRST